jgi:hypothetical protein
MIGEYIRFAPDDLEKVVADPGWARDLVDELWDSEDGPVIWNGSGLSSQRRPTAEWVFSSGSADCGSAASHPPMA